MGKLWEDKFLNGTLVFFLGVIFIRWQTNDGRAFLIYHRFPGVYIHHDDHDDESWCLLAFHFVGSFLW